MIMQYSESRCYNRDVMSGDVTIMQALPYVRRNGCFGKALSAAILLLASQATPAGAQQEAIPTAAEVYRLVSPSVVMIEAQVPDGFVQGSGVVVGDGQIVTNNHVVEASRGFLLVRQGKRTWRAEIDRTDKAYDLALLSVVLRRTERFGLPLARLRKVGSLDIGEKTYAIGAPQGIEQTLSDGLVSGLPTDGKATLVQTTAAISRGSSGGGLFDSRGHLIGITTVYLKEAQNLNFAIPADKVEALQRAPSLLTGEYTFPPQAQPAAESSVTGTAVPRKPPDLPTALRQVRAVIVVATSKGPVATQGGITADWIRERATKGLRAAGIGVYATRAEADKARVYAPPLSFEVSSMQISETVFYPWSLSVTLLDTTDFSDGSNGLVTVWDSSQFGYGGSQIVVQQVADTLEKEVDKFAIAALKGRGK
jgi:S1-C subfamily serine protease